MKEKFLPSGLLLALLLLGDCQAPRSGQVLWHSDQYVLYRDSVVQRPFVARVLSPTELVSNYKSGAQPGPPSRWKMSQPAPAFPQYQSDYPLADALYNLALEGMANALAPDSTFRTGREEAGAWSRDISYSIILSLAALQPRVARHSLLRKVKNGRILQQAYPVATDRMVWALAAWELYKVTGDQGWIREAYPIIRNTLEEDLQNIYDAPSGLFRGGSSFPGSREQTYPEWMQPADIYESENLGTNVLFYQANVILSAMAALLNERPAAARYHQLAVIIKKGINDGLWVPEKGYYGQYRYGRYFKIRSPRSEALGEAMAILFGVTDIGRQKAIVEKTPVTPFGMTSIYPQVLQNLPYPNQGIWPLVQAYWFLAAAKAGNEAALMASMSALYRPAALLLTHQENGVARTVEAANQPNTSHMLESLAGHLGLIYKGLYGLDFQPQSLVFKPVVPRPLKGRRRLTNFRYRQAILDIEMTGYGNQIRSITLDNQKLPGATVPGSLSGRHTVRIELANKDLNADKTNQVAVAFSPATPVVTLAGGLLAWNPVPGAVAYKVLKNGKLLLRTQVHSVPVPADEDYAEYQVLAEDAREQESFANEPVVAAPEQVRQRYELEALAGPGKEAVRGFSGTGFVAIGRQQHTRLRLPVTVPETGWYALDFRYANAAGPAQSGNTCALRALRNGKDLVGTIVLPPRGHNAGSDWGFTNAVQLKLTRGSHTLFLSFEPANENWQGEGNDTLLDYMRLTRIKNEAEPGGN
jgi:hypothetical protein